MGYTTEFKNKFNLNKALDDDTYNLLKGLAGTRRVARNVDPKYGVEGEFYTEGKGFMGQDREPNIINDNKPPKTQPGLWLQWVPTEDRLGLEWDGSEKFYNYEEWLVYLIEKILKPRGYVVNGIVDWYGEDSEDYGTLVAIDNEVCACLQIDKYSKKLIAKALNDRKLLPTLMRINCDLDRVLSNVLNKGEN